MAVKLVSNDSSASVPTLRDFDATADNLVFAQVPLSFSGSYTSGGDTLDLSPLVQAGLPSSVLPFAVSVNSNGPSGSVGSNGGNYQFQKGTTLANGKLKVFATAGTEYSAGAYSTDVTTDVVTVAVTFRKFS